MIGASHPPTGAVSTYPRVCPRACACAGAVTPGAPGELAGELGLVATGQNSAGAGGWGGEAGTVGTDGTANNTGAVCTYPRACPRACACAGAVTPGAPGELAGELKGVGAAAAVQCTAHWACEAKH